jgi:hypothetical protein
VDHLISRFSASSFGAALVNLPETSPSESVAKLSRIIVIAWVKTCDNSNEPDMSSRPSLRTVLAESHISDVAIAVLLFRSLASGIRVLGPPLAHASVFVFTAVAIRDVPYYSLALDIKDRLELVKMFGNLISCLIAAASASAFSRWMYNVGPIRSLSQRFNALRRSSHV